MKVHPCNKFANFVLLASLSVSTMAVADRSRFYGDVSYGAVFYGAWGTQAQCARSLIVPFGTKHYAPFKISADWLQHGDVWCRLSWANVFINDADAAGVANAICGEDDSRNYRINLNLNGDELALVWNGDIVNSRLLRCSN